MNVKHIRKSTRCEGDGGFEVKACLSHHECASQLNEKAIKSLRAIILKLPYPFRTFEKTILSQMVSKRISPLASILIFHLQSNEGIYDLRKQQLQQMSSSFIVNLSSMKSNCVTFNSCSNGINDAYWHIPLCQPKQQSNDE